MLLRLFSRLDMRLPRDGTYVRVQEDLGATIGESVFHVADRNGFIELSWASNTHNWLLMHWLPFLSSS